ncbi:hypothetical protein, partial [Neisseria gonorrhoeae]|uniref:hypothetical protein n=1 Tax=Neisseria gonorrhoeae TaxID=485 RepID=UPI001C851084
RVMFRADRGVAVMIVCESFDALLAFLLACLLACLLGVCLFRILGKAADTVYRAAFFRFG